MQFIVVTGLSGAGKSYAMNVLEDIGFYCIDNMPPKLITKFGEICLDAEDKYSKVAIAVDIVQGRCLTKSSRVARNSKRCTST
jgi:UPF0042 nucleotide-binding protein